MGLYLYCVLPANAPEPDVAGLDAAPVHVVRAEGVSVWVGEVEATPRADLARIRAHDRVMRAALDAGVTPVPIRFGQVVADREALAQHLREHDYGPLLQRVAGALEFGIRILDPEAAAEPRGKPEVPDPEGEAGAGAGRGAAYLRTLAARIHEGEARQARSLAAARDIDGRLAPWVRESHIEATEQPPGALVAHLVQTDGVVAYGAQARELADDHPPLRIIVTGPWPPYSFVDR